MKRGPRRAGERRRAVYPASPLPALGEIKLHEAAQLARLRPDRPGRDPARAGALRGGVLRSHVLDRGSRNGLQARVKDITGEAGGVSGAEMASAVRKADELPEIDSADKRHLSYEEMRRLLYAVREIEPEDVDEDSLDQFMAAAGQLPNATRAVEIRRRRREMMARKLRT